MNLVFAHPELAPLALAAAAITALCAVTFVRRRRALAAFGGSGARFASASPARQVAKKLASEGRSGVIVTIVADGATKYLSEPFWND